MSMWAGLTVNRKNLPCVGLPLDSLYPELFPPLEKEEDIPPPSSLQKGDRVGTWSLLEYRRGYGHNHHAQWRCRCNCGCGKERWIRASHLNKGLCMNCTNGGKGKLPSAKETSDV